MGCGASSHKKQDPAQEAKKAQEAVEKATGPKFPDFKGKVVKRDGTDAFAAASYQYATSSERIFNPKVMQPAAIIYAQDDDDVIKAIEYAKAADVALSVRSGGHSYSGSSSTSGENIQLDLSGDMAPDQKAFPYHTFEYDAEAGTARIGAGLLLADVSRKCVEHGIFFPHGECCHVGIGGHTQTGGYGLIMRPFGMYADYVQSVDFIFADPDGSGKPGKRTVRRDAADAEERELFFALIGGSPGNLGVMTHVTTRVLKDADHPNARGLKLMTVYSKDKLKALLDIMVEQIKNPPAADYCYSVMVLGAQFVGGDCHADANDDIDRWMRENHPTQYPPDGELKIRYVPVIAVTGFFGNLGGASQEYDASVLAPIKEICTPVPAFVAKTLSFFKIIGDPATLGFDDSEPHPISWMIKQWTWKNVREFPAPYHKRLFMSKATGEELEASGWAEWTAERINDIEDSTLTAALNGCKIAAQFMPYGGKNAFNDFDGKTAVAWRDSTAFAAMDVFYDDDREGAIDEALGWAERVYKEGVGADGKFSKQDRRLIWAPFGDNYDLDKSHLAYFDSEEVYQRILAVKRRVDPTGVFTPNLFCVGASDKRRAAEAKVDAEGKKEATKHLPKKEKDAELLAARDKATVTRPLLEQAPKMQQSA